MKQRSCLPLSQKCPACRGQARILRTGNLYQQCSNCGGIGYIQHKVMPEAEFKALEANAEPKKRRKPRKKDVTITEEPKPFSTDDNKLINNTK